jgi:hypothetical protein
MKRRAGPRPHSITIFAAAFLASAVIAYLGGLSDIPAHQTLLTENVPEVVWSRDHVIVLLSARLSIAVIPVALVWFFAASFARWMVTLLALGKLINLPAAAKMISNEQSLDPAWLVSLLLAMLAVFLLFTPASNRWFARGDDAPDPAIFE